MKRVAVTLRPFIFNQYIQIYEDDKLVGAKVTSINSMSNDIKDICQSLSINQIDIKGNKMFTKKIAQELTKINQFEKLNLNITLY